MIFYNHQFIINSLTKLSDRFAKKRSMPKPESFFNKKEIEVNEIEELENNSIENNTTDYESLINFIDKRNYFMTTSFHYEYESVAILDYSPTRTALFYFQYLKYKELQLAMYQEAIQFKKKYGDFLLTWN